jgi:hypothetical protein
VPREKAREARRDLACVKLAAPAQLLCDIGRNISRPSLSGVEADDADGLRILPVEQVLDDGLEVRRIDIGLAPGATASAEIASRPDRRLDPRRLAQSMASNLCHA